MLQIFEEIVHTYPKQTTMIRDFPPVKQIYLENWLRKLGNYKQKIIDETIKYIEFGLPKEKREQFQKKQLLDMEDIEDFQQEFYDVIISKQNNRQHEF
jgi:hypothetical protein